MSRRVRRSAHSYRQSSSSDSDTEGNYSSTTGTGGEDDESVESLVASNTKQLRSPQAGRSNSRGIDKSSQKVLLHHIEAAGGLQAVLQNITAFCNTQASKDTGSKILYGEHYSKERRRVENKIHRWKSLSRAAYLAVLADFQVTPNVVTSSVGVSASQASSRQDMSKSSRKDSESKKAPRSKSVSSSKTTESVSVPTSNINEKPAAKMSSRMETRGGILYGTVSILSPSSVIVGAHLPHNFLAY